MNEKSMIIFDTDMDTDCDDAGALLMLINAHLSRKIDLLGIIADSDCEFAAPFCKTVLKYYGLDIPVGESYGHITKDMLLIDYRNHQKLCEKVAYNRMLSKRDGKIHNSTELYLEMLSKSPNNSVTVLCVGMLTAVYDAIKANKSLFEQKVKQVVVMGNPYKKNDFNFSMDAKSTKGFFEICPCPVFISYLGSDVITGNHLDKALPIEHPVRKAYEIWSDGNGRSSWDLIAALFAINPTLNAFKTVDKCHIEYDDKKKTALLKTNDTRDNIIGLNCTNKEMEDMLNDFLI